MREFTPWLGLCHLRQVADDSLDPQPTLAAVWADSVESFEREMHVYTNSHGQQMTWAEQVMPADEWLAERSHRKDGQRLAGKVSAKHLVVLGGFGAGTTGLGSDGTPDGEDDGYLHIEEHKITNLPDQSHLPFWEQDWIALELKELLFGQDGDSKELLRTYFIVDATLRKNITGVFDLDTLDVPVRCLFKGEAAETMKEAAPYLIDVTLPDGAWEYNDLVSAFHKSFFDKHWGQNTGIFVRTTALMDEVWGHFRKFTKVQVEDDKRWVYFRFWDPRIAPYYFESLKGMPEKVVQWCTIRGTVLVDKFIGNLADHKSTWVVTPDWNNLKGFANIGVPVLSDAEIKGFERYKLETFIFSTHNWIMENYGAYCHKDDKLDEFIRIQINELRELGIKSEYALLYVIAGCFLLRKSISQLPNHYFEILKHKKTSQKEKAGAFLEAVLEEVERHHGRVAAKQ